MAALPVELHPDAVDEARGARLWYAERNDSAAARFQAALDHAIAEVAAAPERWTPYLHGTRRRQLRGFPYWLVYYLRSQRIVVVACQHGRRRPGYWRKRIR